MRRKRIVALTAVAIAVLSACAVEPTARLATFDQVEVSVRDDRNYSSALCVSIDGRGEDCRVRDDPFVVFGGIVDLEDLSPEFAGRRVPSVLFGEAPPTATSVRIIGADSKVLETVQTEERLWAFSTNLPSVPSTVEAIDGAGEVLRMEVIVAARSLEFDQCVAASGATHASDRSALACVLDESRRDLLADS